MFKIYLDNNATTQADPLVIEAIHKELTQGPSNPSSVHFYGKDAKTRLRKARELIAKYLSAKPEDIIFNSGATEGLNTLMRGYFEKHPHGHLITSDLEHSCIYKMAQYLQEKGKDITFIRPKQAGIVTSEALLEAIKSQTGMIILSAVNSETGAKTDLDALAKVAQEKGIALVIDAVALIGKEPILLPSTIAAACFSAHKFHGPKGIGFSLIRNASHVVNPLLIGGEQEFSLRGGTENLPGIMGTSKAVELLEGLFPQTTIKMQQLRDQFEQTLLKVFPQILVNGPSNRICNTSNLAFPEIEGETLLTLLDLNGIAASLGSACASGSIEPSRVLLNMGYGRARASSSMRFSLSRFTTEQEIVTATDILIGILKKLGY